MMNMDQPQQVTMGRLTHRQEERCQRRCRHLLKSCHFKQQFRSEEEEDEEEDNNSEQSEANRLTGECDRLVFCPMKKRQQQQHARSRTTLPGRATTRSQQANPSSTTHTLPRNDLISRLVFVCSLVICALNFSAHAVVVHQVRFIENKTGRTDYALTGEKIELSCHYMMKDEIEDVKQVIWSKDGKNFLRWLKFGPGLEVLSYTYKGHFDPSSVYSHLIINNVTTDMHGRYKCQIKTDLGVHEMENDLVVISQNGCKFNDWRVVSEQTKCQELFRLDCRNMFPRPVPSCGLWNNKLDKFIRSVMVDISEEPNKETYRVRYSDKFDLMSTSGNDNTTTTATRKSPPSNLDLLQYAGHLTFKCDIIVPETSWKLTLAHRMFDYSDGCNEDPLAAIEQMRLNFSHYATGRMQQAGYLNDRRHTLDDVEMLTSSSSSLKYELMPPIRSKSKKIELNCWRKPRVGTLARLSCASGSSSSSNTSKSNPNLKLIGANLLECRPNGWVPVQMAGPDSKKSQPNKPTSTTRKIPRKHRSNSGDHDGAREAPGAAANDTTATTTKDLGKIVSSAPQWQRGKPTSQMPTYSNDLDRLDATMTTTTDDNDDDNSMPSNEIEKPTTTTTIPTTTAVVIETTSQLSGDGEQTGTNSLDSLTPAQLAALLPSCVSTSSRNRANTGRLHPTHRHGDNKLQPSDEAVVLEVSSQRDKPDHARHPSSRYRNEDGGPFGWQWMTFFSSSSSSLSLSSLNLVGSLTLVTCLVVSMLLTNCRPVLFLSN